MDDAAVVPPLESDATLLQLGAARGHDAGVTASQSSASASDAHGMLHHSVTIAESDYPALAAEQSLTVSWPALPAMIVQLLETARLGAADPSPSFSLNSGDIATLSRDATPARAFQLPGKLLPPGTPLLQHTHRDGPFVAAVAASSVASGGSVVVGSPPGQPRFVAVLTVRDGTASSAAAGGGNPSFSSTFSLVEINSFRRLTHLSLPMRQAGDAGLRRYLAARLTATAAVLTSTRCQLASLQSDHAAAQAQVSSLQAALAATQSEAASSAAAASAACAAQVSSLRAGYDQRLGELRQLLEEARRGRAQAEVSGRNVEMQKDTIA